MFATASAQPTDSYSDIRASHTPRISPVGLAVVVLMHVVAFWLLLKLNIIQLPEPLKVLSVSLIQPAEIIEPKPEPIPPQPKPMEKRPIPTPQPVRLAVPAESPVAAPVVQVPPTPVAVAPAPIVTAPAPTPPRFDADYLDNPKPRYPALSRRLGEEGRVVLRVRVEPSGLPSEILLQTSSGFTALDDAALDTVRRWKFVPARNGDQAISAWVLVPISFTLKN